MKKVVFLLVILFVAASCEKEKNLYEPPVEKEKLDFSLTQKITVSSDLPAGTRCLLYTANPSGEATAAKPIMVAYAPFNLEVTVPKAVSKIYSHINGSITAHDRGNITLKSSNATRASAVETRADEQPGDVSQRTLTDDFVTAINLFYPEGLVNVWGDDFRKSSDLFAAQGIKDIIEDENGITTIEYGNTNVWITYVTDGGCNFKGSLWYYTYTVDEEKKPIQSRTQIERTLTPIFTDATPANSKGKRIYLGSFPPGTRIGFKYEGNATYGTNSRAYPKYSTPIYNKQAYNGRYESGNKNHTINGGTVNRVYENFKDNEYTCGVIRSWEYDNVTYATLGMENRLPSESTWDGDFNDMICLIEADPICVENFIPAPTPDPLTLTTEGYWLFEDNYPVEGDYDFNDLVVKYKITETMIGETWDPTKIDLEFVARGANFNNSFGINGTIEKTDLAGYQNVREGTETAATTLSIEVTKTDAYIPMLNNGTVSFDLNSYWDNEEDFPCALNIPIFDILEDDEVVGKTGFFWCLENKRIDDAYPRYKNWVESKCTTDVDWYTDTPVAGLVWDK